MPVLDPHAHNNVIALLGPTNTGKTHRAVERMLAHRTGMIGLPLRLLAREVYDRVSAQKGEENVALVTGEEKRIPERPRYWVCTVEAMPVARPVAFLAVDEIQLCGDRTRGHVFTDRLLHARGSVETYFLGAETIGPLLKRLVPSAQIERQPRFSKLTAVPSRKIGSLPKRSAIVAFSAEDVYALAERVRGAFGGAAVVLGALSPRARNAQIAMYQAGEVQHLVATDAIGMGLNMDIDHVAFAAVRKFDGRGARALSAAELAQIAGRAGRHTRDGTFGSTTDLGPLDPDAVVAIEQHAFPPVPVLFWRNPAIDTSSVGALIASLEVEAPSPGLVRMRDAEDHRAAEALSTRESVRALADSPARVALLWEACQVPEFQKTLTSAHFDLVATLFEQLVRGGSVDEDFVAKRVKSVDRVDGDVGMLMTRIAGIRTWTFIAHRAGWLTDPLHWQARARDVEDRLSDALHARLSERFVDARTVAVVSGAWTGKAAAVESGEVSVGTEHIGTLSGLRFVHDAAIVGSAIARRAADAAIAPLLARQVQACVESPFAAFTVDDHGFVVWDGSRIGRLTAGPHPLEPRVALIRLDALGAGAGERVLRRLKSWQRDFCGVIDGVLDDPDVDALSADARGALYTVVRDLGDEERGWSTTLDEADRRALGRLGVRFGFANTWLASALTPAAMRIRATLWAVHSGVERPESPPHAAPSVVITRDQAPFYRAIGYRVFAGRAVRVDLAEKAAARFREVSRRKAAGPVGEISSWLGCPPDQIGALARAMGFPFDASGLAPAGRPRSRR